MIVSEIAKKVTLVLAQKTLASLTIIDKLKPTEHEKVDMTVLKPKFTLSAGTLIWLLWVNIASFGAFAQSEMDDHQRIEQGAKNYLLSILTSDMPGESVHVEIVTVDSRIVIPTCPSGFNYSANEDSLVQSYISVRVSCNTNEWYLFTSAHVSKTRQIVVTAGMISPGTLLTSQNLQLADIDVRRLRHTAYTDASELLGARMKYRVREGQPIQSNMLCFVCKGDRITISAETSGMKVKTAGIAQQDGVIGDTIEVINANSQKSVIAQVASAQEVVVNL